MNKDNLHIVKLEFRGETEMNKLSKEEIIDIINDILDVKNHTEDEIDMLINKLEDGVTDPEITDYIFYDELPPEEIADKALSYKPICL